MSLAERWRPERWRPSARVAGLAFVLVLVVAALYGQSARHGFVSFDDGSYLTENPHVAGGLTAANARWAFTALHSSNWHPLTWLSHQLDVELFGLAPGPHHLVGAGLHALNALLLFAFLTRATGTVGASFLVALLFAVHPQRVESVAWASERKDLLAGLFFGLCLLAYERWVRAPSPARYAGIALALALGLLAKPMLVSVPFVLLALDRWPLARTAPWSRLVREKLPLFALVAASAAVTLVAQSRGGAVQSVEVLSLSERLATAVLGTLAYLAKLVWPAGLAFFYPHPAFVSPATFAPLGARVVGGALFLGLVTLAAVRLRRPQPWFLTGWAWMGLMLLPVIGLVQVGAQLYADRYAYLPMIGPLLALVFALRSVSDSARVRTGLATLGLLAAGALAARTYGQVGTWRDTRTLCERALAVTEKNYVAHDNLGLFLQRQGDLAGAEEHYRAALAIAPDLPSSLSNLGVIHAARGRRDEAVAAFQRALAQDPEFLRGRMSWGYLLEQEGDLAGAREHYELALRQHPDEGGAWLRLGVVELALGRSAEARQAFSRARQNLGDTAELLVLAGEAEAEGGNARAALAHFAAAETRQPGFERALHGRAWVLATTRDAALRDGPGALAALEGCRARDGGGWAHQRIVAAALAAAGRHAEAARVATEAWAAAPPSESAQLKAERETYLAGRALER